jgi:hypothetical protein
MDDLDVSSLDYTVMINNVPLSFDALNNDYDEDILVRIEAKYS